MNESISATNAGDPTNEDAPFAKLPIILSINLCSSLLFLKLARDRSVYVKRELFFGFDIFLFRVYEIFRTAKELLFESETLLFSIRIKKKKQIHVCVFVLTLL